jgi:hypothetical protein
VLTPCALTATLITTRRERDPGWAWERVEWTRGTFRPL